MQGEKECVSAYEEKLYRMLSFFGERRNRRVVKKCPAKALTLGELLEIAGIDTDLVSSKIKEKLNTIVPQICRAGSRFTKDCVCVQFDEDSDNCMKWAMDNGALVLISRNQIEDYPCIVVSCPEEVYAKMCRYYRDLSEADIIAVAGSIGKTTTKRMIANVLKTTYNTFGDPENENQIDCIGYACQHIPDKCRKLVQEVSEDTPGCVTHISTIIRPVISVITAIDNSHMANFGSKEAIVKEILSIQDSMSEDGVVVINKDDAKFWDQTPELFKRKVITISLENEGADYYSRNIKKTKLGLEFEICSKYIDKPITVKLSNIFANHNIYSALYATAVGVLQGVKAEDIAKGLSCYKTSGYRQNIYRVKGNVLIYADCYNAVAKSIKSALEAADNIPVEGKKIAVLGDVEEAGDMSEKTHCEILDSVNNSEFDVLYAYGEKLGAALADYHWTRDNLKIIAVDNKKDMIQSLKKNINNGDLVLFKASRKSALEEVIKALYPRAYKKRQLEHNLPIIKWRMKVIRS